MPPRARKTSKTTNTNDNNQFQQNIAEWISVTDKIINLEKELEVLREKQKMISLKCINQTNNLSKEVKINKIPPPEKVEEVDKENKNLVKKQPSKLVRRKRKTKADLEKDKLEKQEEKVEEKEKVKNEKKAPNVVKKPSPKEDNKKGNMKEKLKENLDDLSSDDSVDEMSSSDESTELDSLSDDSSSSESSESEDEK